MAKIRANHTATIRQLTIQLNQINTLEELAAVQESLNGRWNQIQASKQADFKIGDPIEWSSNSRRHAGFHKGIVTGFKGINLTAISTTGVQWTLSPNGVKKSTLEVIER